MEYFEVIRNRHSIRAFADRPLDPDILRLILEAANQAPSAGNLQAFEIYALTQPVHKRALARAANEQMFIAEASAVLVFAANPARSIVRYGTRGERLYSIQDATIACTFAMLAAASMGLATVWIGAFSEVEVRKAAEIPENILPVAILPIGHAAEEPYHRPRRSLADLVHYMAD